MNQKTLNIPLEIKQIDEENEFFRFKGLLSTFGNRDRGGDIVQPGAFDDSLARLKQNARPIPGMPGAKKILPILWQHNMSEPIGSFISVDATSRGLEVEGIMPKSDSLVRDRVIPQMKAGSLADMSIGYIPLKTSRSPDDDRLLDVIELLEGSLVTIPMNPAAEVESFKALAEFKDLPLAGRDTAWKCGGAESPDAFLLRDADGQEHKFQIADTVDGELKAIPRGIFAAAATIHAKRYGADLPPEQVDAVKINIERYYDKMGLESPFTEKGFRIDDLEALDERTLEKVLKSGAILPGQQAKTVISALKSSKRDAAEEEKRDADQLTGIQSRLDDITALFNRS
jgi:HK97 family phage prohead protease